MKTTKGARFGVVAHQQSATCATPAVHFEVSTSANYTGDRTYLFCEMLTPAEAYRLGGALLDAAKFAKGQSIQKWFLSREDDSE